MGITTALSVVSGYEYVIQILIMLSGLGVFLFGLKTMGDNLETVAGSKMRNIFDKIGSNRVTGMLTGAGVTAVIQSSSATTVMVVGFVNAGVMTLIQAVPIIMGANIGTTITAQIMALKSLNITAFLAALACVGAFMMMSKKDVLKKIGAILAGLGMIFVGLDLMGAAMDTFKDIPAIRTFFMNYSNPFLLLVFGLAFTALIQSSSAATGILVSMCSVGLMPLSSAMIVLLGVNMGTCITAALAAIGTTQNAKRVAVVHFLFNFIGALIFFPILIFLPVDKWMQTLIQGEGAITAQVAMFHTIFNVSTTLLLIFFVKPLVLVSTKLVPDKKPKAGQAGTSFVSNRLKYIDSRLLSTPVIAMSQVQKEVVFMAELAGKNLELSVNSIIEGKRIDNNIFEERESQINFLNTEISKFLVKLSATEISFKDEMIIASYYHVTSDIERIGDYAENIMEYSDELTKFNSTFSESAIEEIRDMYAKICNVYENSIRVFETKDLELLDLVNEYENQVDECKRLLGLQHVKRLNNNSCSPATGAVYLSLISNLERIADHMVNIAKSIREYTSKPKKVSASVKTIKIESNKK